MGAKVVSETSTCYMTVGKKGVSVAGLQLMRWDGYQFVCLRNGLATAQQQHTPVCLTDHRNDLYGSLEIGDGIDSSAFCAGLSVAQAERMRKSYRKKNPYSYSGNIPWTDLLRTRWLYRGYIVDVDPKIDSNEKLALLVKEAVWKYEKKFKKLSQMVEIEGLISKAGRRESISEEVRIFVWNRDEKKCVMCGSQRKLEYDHIIPVSEGGSSTARNIQILCEACNRSKGAKI